MPLLKTEYEKTFHPSEASLPIREENEKLLRGYGAEMTQRPRHNFQPTGTIC